MIQASNAYKEMMKKPIRNRGYVSVALGVINQNAQGDVWYLGNSRSYGGIYYSKGDIFKDLQSDATYGSLEQNFTKANGKFSFPPRENTTQDFFETGYISGNFDGYVEWEFNTEHDIKGLTIEFQPTSYPTAFTITTDGTDGDTYHFTNNSATFETNTTFGQVSRFILQVDEDEDNPSMDAHMMSGGAQLLHIRRILCGIGVTFQGDVVESVDLESFISSISGEISYKELDMTALDMKETFDVDSNDSLINYLEPLQPIAISFGVDLDDGTKEWIKVADLKLKEWNSKRGHVSFTATDVLTQDEKNYSHMVLQSRTAKSEFEAIFADMGLIASDYHIDDYLASVYITNPIEENLHRDCLQLLANATRSVVYEDENGVIQVRKAFDTVTPPSDTETILENIKIQGGNYVSEWVADEYGTFADESKNLYDSSDANNVVLINSITPQDGNVYVQDGLIQYDGVAYEERVYSTIDVEFDIGQLGNHSPFKEVGWYVITPLTHYSTPNDYLTFDYATMILLFGDEETTGEIISPTAIKINVTQAQLDKGVAPRLSLTLTNVRVRGYHGSFGIQVVKGDQELPAEPYKFDLKFPTIEYRWETPQAFSQAKIVFSDVIPAKVNVIAYSGDTPTYADLFTPMGRELEIQDNFGTINRISIAVVQGVANKTVAISDFVLGNAEAYTLHQQEVFELYKAKEARVKEVKVKIYTYQIEDGEIVRVDDDVWYTETVGIEGVTKICENPLISSSAQAELLAKWLANYYTKSKAYSIESRGEPTLQANDCIRFENKYNDMSIVNIEKCKITFNGAFHENIEARQAN